MPVTTHSRKGHLTKKPKHLKFKKLFDELRNGSDVSETVEEINLAVYDLVHKHCSIQKFKDAVEYIRRQESTLDANIRTNENNDITNFAPLIREVLMEKFHLDNIDEILKIMQGPERWDEFSENMLEYVIEAVDEINRHAEDDKVQQQQIASRIIQRMCIDVIQKNENITDLTKIYNLVKDIQKQRKQRKLIEDKECPVCLSAYTDNAPRRPKVLLPCRHVVCEACISRLHACPICRAGIQSTVFFSTYTGEPAFFGGRQVHKGPRGGRYTIINGAKHYIS
jgi:hypothetical protein